jgi:hypothetical protein
MFLALWEKSLRLLVLSSPLAVLDELRNSHWRHVGANVVCATEWLVAQMAG